MAFRSRIICVYCRLERLSRGSSLALRGQRLMSCSASVEEPHLEPVLGRERPRIGAVRLLSGENATHTKVRGKTGTADNAPD